MGGRRIPKSAVKPLIEYCNKLGEKIGVSGAEVFKKYLEWMKKHADYFFSSPWPERHVSKGGLWLSDEASKFIEGSSGYEEEIERFTVVVLKRNISMEGFNAENFDAEFEFYGKIACDGCAVPDAMHLREHTKKVEQFQRELEEKISSDNPSEFWVELYEYHKKPEAIRADKMPFVELRLLEENGGAAGKSCAERNKYQCPYEEKSKELIEIGGMAKFLWRLVQFYDWHWNRSQSFTPPACDAKWYHYDEPGIIDVTSYDDIIKALEDGRMAIILKEYKKYNEEKEANR